MEQYNRGYYVESDIRLYNDLRILGETIEKIIYYNRIKL